ncbi:armadillo repeat protein [Ceratobasidium sp. AG-Ba]|nr:armadillo repeat protein [Ceratobasidium sp. AG-Ba]
MVDAQATLDTLRNIKNTVIGNPVAKNKLTSDGTVTLVLEWINAHQGTSEPIFELIRIEAAHIIAAQAYGPPEALLGVLEAQAPRALIVALKSPGMTDAPKLATALTRALRSVIAAAADAVGPFRWHLPRLIAHPARSEARLVLEDVFSTDDLNVILPLLRHSELEVRRNVALLLGRGVRIDAHRARVAEWNDRAAVWSLVEMLGGDARSQSSALYALAELSRDNETVARMISSSIPPFLPLSCSIPFPQPSELGFIDSPISPMIERGRTIEPLSLFALTGRSRVGPRSMSRSISGSGSEVLAGPRILDIVRELLNARHADVREAACLCLSTVIRQIPPVVHDPSYALVAWLNVTLEDFAPGPESSEADSEAESCRWKSSELGGGEAAARVVRACYILADFVNDRPELQQVAVKAGTLQRAVRALLALPPVPVPPSGWVPIGRWGPSSVGTGPSVGLAVGVLAETVTMPGVTSRSEATRPGSMTIGIVPGMSVVGGPSGLSRTRRTSSATPTATSATAASTNIPPPSTSPFRTAAAPPPLPAWNTTPASTATGRRLSFAELARRGSESGAGSVETFTPRARRPSGAGTSPVNRRMSITSSGEGTGSNPEPAIGNSINSGETMAVDPTPPAPSEDVVMSPAQPMQPAPIQTPTTRRPESTDVIMNSVAAPALISASAPAGPAAQQTTLRVALSPAAGTRRRRKPPPDPALGPYIRLGNSHVSTSRTLDPTHPTPPAPTSLRAALLILLAALVMHKEEHRRMLVDGGALGVVLGRAGSGGVKARVPGSSEGVTGVLGALGSPDAEVRWSATMVVRAVGRSTSVLRTGLYDSGIGRAIFELLMRGDPDRRVLVAVLMACCNMLNHYSPMREMFIRDGGMARLVELADDTEPAVKLNALWAIKNSLFKSTTTENRIVLSVVGFPRLNRLLEESADEVLEQVLGIVRNVTITESDAEWLVQHVTAPRLLAAIERALSSESTALAALFALTHLAFASSIRAQALTRRRTLEFPRVAWAVWQVVDQRLRELREVGIDARLRVMRSNEEDAETRDHAKRALSVFEGRDA